MRGMVTQSTLDSGNYDNSLLPSLLFNSTYYFLLFAYLYISYLPTSAYPSMREEIVSVSFSARPSNYNY